MNYMNTIIGTIKLMEKKVVDAINLDESYRKLQLVTDTLEEQIMALDVGEMVITDAKALARQTLDSIES